jgi:hypothetical protein
MYRSIRRGLHKEGNSILENENDGASGWNVRGDINKTQLNYFPRGGIRLYRV